MERELLYWLAIEREAVAIDDLHHTMVHPALRGALLEALDGLLRRSLVESRGDRFTLQPVVMEYLTDRFVQQVCQELAEEQIGLLMSHALIKAQAKDYVRESQVRLILRLVAQWLLAIGKAALEAKCKRLLSFLHETHSGQSGYAAGNVLNLLIELGIDLRGYDFSHLAVWQAYLQEAPLQEVNFAHANLATSVFTDTFAGILWMTLSRSGKLAAAVTIGNEIRVWQVPGGTPLITCPGHDEWVYAVAFSPDEQTLASCGDDQTIRIWDARTGECLKALRGHNGLIWSVAFSPDEQTLASCGDDQTIRLWDARTGECLKVLSGHGGQIWSVAFSPESSLLVSSNHDGTINVWDVQTRECLQTLHGHSGRIRSVAFSPGGEMLVSAGDDQTARLWDAQTMAGYLPAEVSIRPCGSGTRTAASSSKHCVGTAGM